MYTYIRIYVYGYAQKYIHMFIYSCSHTCTLICTYIDVIFIYVCACMYIYVHMCTLYVNVFCHILCVLGGYPCVYVTCGFVPIRGRYVFIKCVLKYISVREHVRTHACGIHTYFCICKLDTQIHTYIRILIC